MKTKTVVIDGVTYVPEIPKNVMDRIKTIEDVLADNNTSMEEFEEECDGLTEDEKAYRLIKLICKSLNEWWEPNWGDSNERKYFPWFDMSSSGFRANDYDYWLSHSYVGSRLCFKSKELAKYAGTQFTDVYQKFMLIK